MRIPARRAVELAVCGAELITTQHQGQQAGSDRGGVELQEDTSAKRRAHRDRWVTGLGALWALALLGWIVLLAIEWYLTGPTNCPLTPTSSLYGTAEWSWLPPGSTCTWEVPGGTHTDAPSSARVGIVILFILWGGSLLVLRRSRKGE